MATTLALTPGDPGGIGPEITVKALQKIGEFPDTKFLVIGSLKALESAAAQLNLPLPKDARVDYHPVEDQLPGRVAYYAIDLAVKKIAGHEADALVTGPISKRNLEAAGHDFPGHTEILEDATRRRFNLPQAKAEMLFVYKNFRLLLLTRHVALREALRLLSSTENISQPLKTLADFLQKGSGIAKPKLAFLGINPHAGETGGHEEETILWPAMESLQKAGTLQCEGPFAADGFFRGFDPLNPGYDAVIAAYHDQGLIPFKILAGFDAVNMTIGLPFIRTSVGHGTAEDIAGKGKAREDGLIAAIRAALQTLNYQKTEEAKARLTAFRDALSAGKTKSSSSI